MLFSKPLPVGTPAPLFTCPDESGNTVSLEDLRGSSVVLIFYPGDSTPTCTRQLCAVRDRWVELQERGVRVFGVNPFSAASHRRFRDKYTFPFPLLVDEGQRVAALYQANGLWIKRTVYGIDPEGVICFSERGNPTVKEILAGLP